MYPLKGWGGRGGEYWKTTKKEVQKYTVHVFCLKLVRIHIIIVRARSLANVKISHQIYYLVYTLFWSGAFTSEVGCAQCFAGEISSVARKFRHES